MKKIMFLIAISLVAMVSCKAKQEDKSESSKENKDSVSESINDMSKDLRDTMPEEYKSNFDPKVAPASWLPASTAVDTVGYKLTDSGMMYKEIKAGKGKKPTATSVVKVHYTGKHLDGTVFDSSVERGEPAVFPLNRVIPGWTEGVQMMSPGAKYQFIIPSKLAYGPNGIPGGPIKPNETLYFEVELLQILQ